MRFDMADLRLFVAVVEAGSITHGAARAHLAPASASGRIRQMEDAIGVPLFERQRLGVAPTDAGHALLRHARTLLADMQRLTDELGEFSLGLKGTVRLLANTSALTECVPKPVARFLAAHPNINIDVEERLSHEIVGALHDGDADIGIVAAEVEVGALQAFPFATERLCAIVPAHAPAFEGLREIGFAALLDHDFVGYAAGAAIQNYLDAQARTLHRRIRARIRLRNIDAICRMVSHGVGVSVVPETAARRYRDTMALRVLDLTDPWALRDMLACVKARDTLSACARQLLDHLVDSATNTHAHERG